MGGTRHQSSSLDHIFTTAMIRGRQVNVFSTVSEVYHVNPSEPYHTAILDHLEEEVRYGSFKVAYNCAHTYSTVLFHNRTKAWCMFKRDLSFDSWNSFALHLLNLASSSIWITCVGVRVSVCTMTVLYIALLRISQVLVMITSFLSLFSHDSWTMSAEV